MDFVKKNDANNTIVLQKYLSQCSVASRRKSESFIEDKRVKINGRIAKLGDRVNPKKDIVTIDDKLIKENKSTRYYIMLNKPRGFITTMSDERGRKCVADLVKDIPERVYPAGRLDKDSEGLLLLTNQGELVNKMMRSGNQHEKEYVVTVNKPVTKEFIKKMQEGVPILGTKTRKCRVIQTGEKSFRIILTQGLNRQIRRMCQYLGYEVKRLKRIRVMNIELGDLPVGAYREVTAQEMKTLQEMIKDSSETTVIKKERGKKCESDRKNEGTRRTVK